MAITWVETPTIYKITLPSGSEYFLKDHEARGYIQDLRNDVDALSNATHWLGVTTSQISDGSTTNPITIGGDSVTAVSGDIVQRQDTAQEFIFNGTSWQELGTSVGTLKAFAYVDQGEVTVTPSGTNASSSVTFSGGTTDTFVKSYPGASGKLVKTTVPNVTSAGSVGTAASWLATVSNENLTFAWTTNTPTTPATLGTAITVATGAIANDGTGDTVMTGLGTATTATAVTGVGTATAAAQTFTGTATTYDVDPKSSS